jgi:hypothetical protein
MEQWAVFVRAGDRAVSTHDDLDALERAVGRQGGSISYSVAGGKAPSAFVTLEAPSAPEAKAKAEAIVAAALGELGWSGEAAAALVYDADGNVAG